MPETERPSARAPLNGWRNIAAYLACDQSTVKRWAATRNLPVYRPAGAEARKGVPVFAYADELDQWLKGQIAEPATGARSGTVEAEPEEAPPPPVVLPAPPPARRRGWMRAGLAAALLSVALLGAGGLLFTAWHAGAGAPSDPYGGLPPEARQYYLDAYYLWQKRTPDTLSEARSLLTKALEVAPRFARAEADLATVYNLMVEYEVTSPEVGYELSRAAAERAIAIDPSLAPPYSVLGDILYFWDRDYQAGLDRLRQAVELDPGDVTSRHWYASALMASGHFDDAAGQIEVARQLEPLSRSIVVSEAMIRLGQGQALRARDLLARLVENEPDYRSPYRFLAFSDLALNDYPGYLSALHTRFSLTGDPAADRIVSAGEAALERAGRDGMAEAMREAATESADLVKDPSIVAHFLALGGDSQGAVQWLIRTPSRRFTYYGIDPAYAAARQDPAFRAAILEAGIPAIW